MAEPIQIQVFDAFLGTEEGVHSVILPDIFSPSGSKNVFMDKIGRVKKIDGYTAQNPSGQVVTNVFAAPAQVIGLFPYRKSAAGVLTRQLVGVFQGTENWLLKYSTDDGTTWTTIANLGPLTAYPDFAQFGADLFITNGSSTPRTWNGTTLTVSGGTQSPQPTGAATPDPGTLKGSYKYKIVSRETDSTRSPGSRSSDPVSVEDGQIQLTWAQDPNSEVGGYEVYRTTGTGVTFYFVTYLDGISTVSFLDTVPDTTILENRPLDEHGDAPEAVYFAEAHKGRVWWLRTDTYPSRAWWSDPGDADSVYGFHYLDFSDHDTQGDVITGAMGNFGEQFIVFTEKAVWSVSGTGAILLNNLIDWNKERKNVQTGSVSHKSVVRVPAGARYVSQTGEINTTTSKALAYFTPLGDIRLFDGQNDIVISHPLKDTLSSFTYSARSKVHAYHDADRSQFVWWVPTNNEGNPNKGIVWNYRWGSWYVWEPYHTFLSSTDSENELDAHFQLVGDNQGYIHKMFSGTDFNGRNFSGTWTTKTLRGVVNVKDDLDPALAYQKRFRWADVLFKVDADVDLTVEWLRAEANDDDDAIGSEIVGSTTATLVTADGDTILTADGDTVVVRVPAVQAKVRLVESDGRYVHGLGLRLRLGDNAEVGTWAVEGISFAYQILPGLKRRSQ